MKRVVSISLGSSRRDHRVEQLFGDQTVCVERIGTDGDKHKAIALIRQLDGQVDAFGLGGTDLYIYAGRKRYTFRESVEIAAAARLTPIVDGSGIKNSLERRMVGYLTTEHQMNLRNKNVLLVCAVDRFGLAESFVQAGCRLVCGDLMFGLGLPIPVQSLESLARLARVAAPVITKLPISLFYPTGEKQTESRPKFTSFFHQADIIAGDFHFIRRYMPRELPGKMVVTNTVTTEDEALLKASGVQTLVTTTPLMNGRSFGTNVLEGILVALSGKAPDAMTNEDYCSLMDRIGIKPRVTVLSALKGEI